MGAIVEEVSPGFANPLELFRIHWYAGAANLMRSFPPEKQALMDPGLLQIADEGARYSLMEYMEAMGEREALGQHMKRFHETYRLLLTPTLPLPAFEAGEEFPVDSGMTRWFDWTPSPTLQPDAAAGGHHSLRRHLGRAAGRSADRGRAL